MKFFIALLIINQYLPNTTNVKIPSGIGRCKIESIEFAG